jgi:hypothetical protein
MNEKEIITNKDFITNKEIITKNNSIHELQLALSYNSDTLDKLDYYGLS